jgi:hypothetical protein
MSDRTRNYLSPTQEFLERDIIITEWYDMFMHNALYRKSHYHEERGLSTRVGNFSVQESPEVENKSHERVETCSLGSMFSFD